MKAERLLSALLLLQAHGRLAEREIAERLEVSQRTAHRDMEALCAAGIPLVASVSACSILAVRLAREVGMTLAGFLRGRRFVVYAGGERLGLAAENVSLPFRA